MFRTFENYAYKYQLSKVVVGRLLDWFTKGSYDALETNWHNVLEDVFFKQ